MTVAYTRYVLDIGQSKTLLALQTATAPCFLGYAEIARRVLKSQPAEQLNLNRYRTWIESYSSADFVEVSGFDFT